MSKEQAAEAKWFFSLSQQGAKKKRLNAQQVLDLEPAYLRSRGVPLWETEEAALDDLDPKFKGVLYDYEVTVQLVGTREIK